MQSVEIKISKIPLLYEHLSNKTGRGFESEFKFVSGFYNGFTAKYSHIQIRNVDLFNFGKRLDAVLRQCEQFEVFIATLGEAHVAAQQKFIEDPLLYYLSDIIASELMELCVDMVSESVIKRYVKNGSHFTNRYSPGYCGWSLIEQKKLFSCFPSEYNDVSLNKSYMMLPVKSISGIIGFGKNAKFFEHKCENCSDIRCLYRKC